MGILADSLSGSIRAGEPPADLDALLKDAIEDIDVIGRERSAELGNSVTERLAMRANHAASVGDRCLWDVGGMVGEDDDEPHLTATAPAVGRVRLVVGDVPRVGKSPKGSRQTLAAADGSWTAPQPSTITAPAEASDGASASS